MSSFPLYSPGVLTVEGEQKSVSTAQLGCTWQRAPRLALDGCWAPVAPRGACQIRDPLHNHGHASVYDNNGTCGGHLFFCAWGLGHALLSQHTGNPRQNDSEIFAITGKKSYVSRVCRVLETDTQVCSTTIQVTPTPDKNRGH